MPENKERSSIRLVNLPPEKGVSKSGIFNIATATSFISKKGNGRVWVTPGGSVIKEESANGEFYLLLPEQALRWFFKAGLEKNCPHDILKSMLIK